MEDTSSFFMGMAKVAFVIAVGLGCLALALLGLAKLLQGLGLMLQRFSGSNGHPTAPESTPQAATEGDEPERSG